MTETRLVSFEPPRQLPRSTDWSRTQLNRRWRSSGVISAGVGGRAFSFAGGGLLGFALGVALLVNSTLLAGRVDQRHAGGIRQREIDEGKILLCSSTPLEDLDIDA